MLSKTVGLITGLTMDIALTNEREPYIFGDNICGKLIINNKDPALKCFTVKLRLSGLLVIRCDNRTETLTDTVFNKKFPLIDSDEVVFWNQAEDGLGPQRMFFPQGVTEFPFAFDTKNYFDRPPSHECSKGAVRWFLEAEFHRPLNFDVNTKRSIIIFPRIELNDPSFDLPVSNNAHLLVTSFLGTKQRGNVEAILQIHRRGFLPGQAAHVTAGFANQCEDVVTLKNMVIKIFQYTQCTESRTRTGKAEAVVFNQDIRSQPLTTKKGDKSAVNVDIIIPYAVPSFQHPNMTVTYNMTLIAQTSTGTIEVSCPFFLGVREPKPQPLQSGGESADPAAPAQPVAAPAQPVAAPAQPAAAPAQPAAAPVQDQPPSQEDAAAAAH